MMRFQGRWNKHNCAIVRAYDGRKRVGEVQACIRHTRGRDVVQIYNIHVAAAHRQQRIGTRLYEHLADLACERDLPIASAPSWQRNRLSTGFWLKQVAKGRVDDAGDGVYVLKQRCNVDLSRPGRRFRKT